MLKLFTVILFYSAILCPNVFGINNDSSKNSADPEFVFTVVGLYSECSNSVAAENRTEMNNVARLTRRYVQYIPYTIANFSEIQYGSQIKIDVHHYDMCSEKGNANIVQIIEIMMLDDFYFFQEPGKNYKTSTIGAFFIFMSDDLTARLRSLVHGIPIFDSNFKDILKNEYRLYSNFLLKLAKLYHWNKLMFFFLEGSDNVFYREYRNKCMETFKEENYCVYQKDIRADGKIDYETKTWLIEHRPTIVLFGLNRLQKQFFLANAGLLKDLELQIFLHDYNDDLSFVENGFILVIGDTYRIRLNWELGLGLYFGVTKADLPEYFKIGLINNAMLNCKRYFDLISAHWNQTIRRGDYESFKILRQQASSTNYHIADRSFKVLLNYGFIRDIGYLVQSSWVDNYDHFQDLLPFLLKYNFRTVPSNCTELICPPGFYKAYGNVTMGFAWKCEPCPVNFYKSNYGNTACFPCTGLKSVDDGKRTACVDPYKEVLLESSSERYFVVAVCGIGLLTTLTTLTVFLLKRNTPIVSLCDFKVSMGHMILIMLIFIGVSCSLLIHPSNFVFCLMKVVLISIGYT